MPLADLLGGFGGGFAAGSEIMGGLQDAKRQGKLAQLLQQGVDSRDQRQGALSQIARIGGQEALTSAQGTFGKMDDAARDDLAASAGQFAAIAEADESAAAQMYPSLAAKARAIGIPVPMTYDKRFLPAIQKLAVAGQRVGTNAELQTFQAMAQGLTPDELAEARKIQLGLAPKKSSAAIKYMEVVGPDGRTRIVAVDPNTVSGEVLGTGETYGAGVGGPRQPATAGNGSISVSLDGVPADKQQRMAQTIAMMRQAGYSDPEIDQFVQTSMGGNSAGAPAPQPSEALPPRMDYANGGYATNPFVSPTEAESAYNKERAQQQAQIDTLPTLNRLNAEGAALKESATGAAQTANAPGLKAGEEFGKEAGKAYAAIQEAGRTASKERARLSQLRTLLQTTYTGPGANALLGIKRAANAFGFNVEGLAEAEAARALSNQLALSLRNPAGGEGMPGAMSDSDRAFLQQSVPSLSNSPQGWRAMVDMRLALADAAVKQAQYAEQLRRQGVPIQDIPGMLQDFANQNPIFNGGAVASSQQSGGNVIRYDAQGNRIQ